MSSDLRVTAAAWLQKLINGTEADDRVAFALILLLSIWYSFGGVFWDVKDPYFHLWFERPQSAGAVRQSTTRDIGLELEKRVSQSATDQDIIGRCFRLTCG